MRDLERRGLKDGEREIRATTGDLVGQEETRGHEVEEERME